MGENWGMPETMKSLAALFDMDCGARSRSGVTRLTFAAESE
jgi:hypothetical protein